jgi:hypothetical protein
MAALQSFHEGVVELVIIIQETLELEGAFR